MLASTLMQRITAVTRGDLKGEPPPPQELDSLPTQKNFFVLFRVIDHPKNFLKAPSPPIYTNFEGERVLKIAIFFVKIFYKVPKNGFFDCFFFSKICLLRRKFCQNRGKTVLGESSKNQFGQPKNKKKVVKVFEIFLKIHPTRENSRSAPGSV